MSVSEQPGALRELWERELGLAHRWGQARHGSKVVTEHTHLKAMWDIISPHAHPPQALLAQILALEICNWNLDSSVLALCRAIGANERTRQEIGHLASCSEERWLKIWAYYLALRDWLPHSAPGGAGAMLRQCDPDESVVEHVHRLLGEPTTLKALYVERFCLTLEYWLHGLDGPATGNARALRAAIDAVEAEIAQHQPGSELLHALALEGNLFPCHHKLFRRFAIILSSIGVGKWRGAMPVKGDGPAERAAEVEKLLRPIDAWLHGTGRADDRAYLLTAGALGEPNPTKRFLAALLISLLRAQKRVE